MHIHICTHIHTSRCYTCTYTYIYTHADRCLSICVDMYILIYLLPSLLTYIVILMLDFLGLFGRASKASFAFGRRERNRELFKQLRNEQGFVGPDDAAQARLRALSKRSVSIPTWSMVSSTCPLLPCELLSISFLAKPKQSTQFKDLGGASGISSLFRTYVRP